MLRLELLGTVALRAAPGGPAIDLPALAPQALLLIALGDRDGVPRDRLCGWLWPEVDPARARQRLRQLLSALRAAGVPLQPGQDRLSFAAGAIAIDALEFEIHARAGSDADALQALALYRGALAASIDADADAFDGWLAAERSRLARLAQQACARLCAADDPADGAARSEALRRWTTVEPCSELAHRALMRAAQAEGRHADALAQYERCADALQAIGARPQPETAALAAALRSAQRGPAMARSTPSGALSIAVLPLSTLQRDAERLEPLALALADDLGAVLARRPGVACLAVGMGRAALQRAQGDLLRASEMLGVRYLVTGGLRATADGGVRLTINLVSGEDALYVWGLQADLDPAAPHEEMVTAWAAEIELQAIVAATAAQRTPDERGWDEVRRANRALFERGWSEASVRDAIEHYRRAVGNEPDHALAWAQKAIVGALASTMGLLPGTAPRDEARADAERALGLAPRNSEVLGYAGCALADLGDPRRAEPYVQRAIDADPTNAQAWAAAGATQLQLGRTEQGIVMLERGLRLGADDHRRPVWLTLLAGAHQRLGRLDQAAETARAGCRADPLYYPARLALAAVELERGQTAHAQLALREALRIRPALTPAEARGWVRKRLFARLLDCWPGR